MTTTEFDDFFERLRQQTNIGSQTELARFLGVDRSAVTQAKNRGVVPEKWVLKLSRTFGIDLTSPDLTSKGPGQAAAILTNFHPVPKVKARLCAGGGSFLTEGEIEDYYAFREDWLTRKGKPSDMVLMDIIGNSMEPEIKEGDTVLIDESQKAILAHAIYAVGVDDAVMVKRVEKRPGKLVLLSDNRDYTPIELAGDEIEQVRIIGRVIWSCRELR